VVVWRGEVWRHRGGCGGQWSGRSPIVGQIRRRTGDTGVRNAAKRLLLL